MSFRHLAAVVMTLAIVPPAYGQSPLTLEEALRLAEVAPHADTAMPPANPRLIGPLAEADAARAGVEQARLRPNPELSFEAENIAGSGAFSGFQATEYTLSIGQRFELGGKRDRRVRAAQAEVGVADARADLARADLALLVRQRYVAAVAAQARVALADDVIERNRELARIARVLVEVGREPPLRSLRADAALAEAEARREAASAASLATRAALAALWTDDSINRAVPAVFPEIEPPGRLLVARDALELHLATREREAARAAIARERSLGVPDPTISAGVRRFEESGDEAFLVGVTIPLPFSNRNQGNVRAAEARLRAAGAREAVALADIRQRIAQARSDYLAAEGRVATLSQISLPQAEEALRLVSIGYRAGRFPLIEVLSAAEARDAIRETLIEAQETRGQAAALLIRLAATSEGIER